MEHPASSGEAAAPLLPGISHEPTPLWWRGAIVGAVALLIGGLYLLQNSLDPRVRAACGVVCFIGLIASLSSNLRAVNWRTVGFGFGLQLLLALFILKFEIPYRPADMSWGTYLSHLFTLSDAGAGFQRPGFDLFATIGAGISAFLNFANDGARFVFGPLADPAVLGQAFPGNGFIFAFSALPTIIFVSSFFTVLYYFGILQFIVKVMARGMIYLLRTSGAESLSAVANVFMGQTEAPLIVKPYVPRMTESELLAMMVGGMATISGGVMAVYIQLGADPVAILTTSVMAAPCGLYLSKLLIPETRVPATSGHAEVPVERLHKNMVDAAAGGASDGMSLALNVAAMLIAFLAFLAMIDALLGTVKSPLIWGFDPESVPEWANKLSLSYIFSYVFSPVAFLMGADKADIGPLADLLGIKLVANEFVSYTKLTSEAVGGYRNVITPRGYALATYALTGFANFASIGIQLGGIGGMAPMRRSDLARLGGRALLAGFVATLINASIAGIFLSPATEG